MAGGRTVDFQLDYATYERWKSQNQEAARIVAFAAGRDALRSARTEASRFIRAKTNLKAGAVSKGLVLSYPKPKQDLIWSINAKIAPMRVIDYTGVRPTKRGVTVAIKKGRRSLIPHAFIATMPKSGHRGVFRRTGTFGRNNNPSLEKIKEVYTTRVADAFSDAIPTAAAKGQATFSTTFKRLMALQQAHK